MRCNMKILFPKIYKKKSKNIYSPAYEPNARNFFLVISEEKKSGVNRYLFLRYYISYKTRVLKYWILLNCVENLFLSIFLLI